MADLDQAIATLGIELPEAPKPVATYVPAMRTGNLLFISGQVPFQEGELVSVGPVPSKASPEDARQAARLCVINALAVARDALGGSLDQVRRIVRVGVFVASDPTFTGQPEVANGASDLLVELMGDDGRHARAAVGSVSLPLGATVEVEMILQVGD